MAKEKSAFTQAKLKKEVLRRYRINNHLAFMNYTWMSQTDPFTVGFHTKRISARLDQAVEDLKNGKSTFLRISVHQRSGKSQMVSVYLPPRILAMNPEAQIMQVSYNQGMSQGFATEGMRLIDTPRYQELFPNVSVGKSAVSNWNLEIKGKETMGHIYASGLHSGLTGHGYHVGILDDYCGSRRDAESIVARNNMWDSFTNDFMTRRAPVSITVVLATWWHSDDIHGRIENKNNPEHDDYDPNFPVFEHLSFPAKQEDWEADHPDEETYKSKYLFGERFSDEWYQEQYATLGDYASSAMMDCAPTARFGNILDTSHIRTHETMADFPTGLKWYRVWDYAHSTKQRAGADPDFTGGTLLAYQLIGSFEGKKKYALWIQHYVQFRMKGPQRDAEIRKIAQRETNKILVESSLDSLDGANDLKMKLSGIRSVILVNCKGDKVTRCDPVEPIFEAGNVHVLRGPWNSTWLRGIKDFDGTGKTHDEMVDNVTCGYQYCVIGSGYKKLPDPYL